MQIRSMQVEDISSVINIAKEEVGFSVSDGPENHFWTKEQLTHWVNSDDVLLVAEVDGHVVGFVLTAHHKPTGKITWENQAIIRRFRGRGVAQALAKELESRLKQKGATYLHFLVRDDNRACSFYARLGYDAGHKFVWFGKHL